MKTLIFHILMAFLPLFALAKGDEKARLDSAEAAFSGGNYLKALDLYEKLLDEGYYSEVSLYRMAFLNEQLQNFPAAIYCLKRISQDFGGKHLSEKIVQLMQKNGSASYLTDELWTGYYLLWHRYGWIVWLAFFLSGLALAALFVLYMSRENPAYKTALFFSGPLFGIVAIGLLLHLFFAPQRAVILNSTAFYSAPAYSSEYRQFGLSTGETVTISSRKDIWCEIRAGEKVFWVPEFVLREL